MSVLLPAGLPAGFTLEPASGAQASEVFALTESELVAAFGFCPDTVEDVRALLEPPPECLTTQTLVRDERGGLAQWWSVLKEPGDPVFYAGVTSDPRLPLDVHDQLGATGWAVLLDWVRGRATDEDRTADGTIKVQSFCPVGSDRPRRRLDAAGFTRKRTFWEMTGPVTDAARTPPLVPGLTIATPDDLRLLHAVLDKAFEGHWGFTPSAYDDWLVIERSMPGYDASLWYLASMDEVPAAGMILSRRVQEDDALYVQELATLEEFRRRGVASALLALAFARAADEGLGRLSLHVDSENSDDAPALYRNAGLRERCAFDAYIREMTT